MMTPDERNAEAAAPNQAQLDEWRHTVLDAVEKLRRIDRELAEVLTVAEPISLRLDHAISDQADAHAGDDIELHDRLSEELSARYGVADLLDLMHVIETRASIVTSGDSERMRYMLARCGAPNFDEWLERREEVFAERRCAATG